MLPLQDITVVALEQAVAAPFATRQLADLGARVIKIERPGRRRLRPRLRRHGPRAVELLRVAQPGQAERGAGPQGPGRPAPARRDARAGRRVRAEPRARARPSASGSTRAAARAASAADHLRDLRLRLRTARTATKKAYDLLVQCETGLLSVTGTPDEPAKAGISVADIAAGMYAYSGILAALYERERTGAGSGLRRRHARRARRVDEPALPVRPLRRRAATAHRRPPRLHRAVRARTAPATAPRCSSACRTNGSGRRSAPRCWTGPDLARDPRFATNTDRVRHNDELTGLIEEALSALTAHEATRPPRTRPASPTPACVPWPSSPRIHSCAARDRWRDVATPAGPVRSLLPPVTLSGRRPAMGRVPDLGEHTAAVRAEFGPPPTETEPR